MTTTSSATLPLAPTLRREDSRIGRTTLPLWSSEASWGVNVVMRAWNVCVYVDRRGRMTDDTYRAQALGKEFGQGLRTRKEWPLIEKTVQEYRKRRALANGPQIGRAHV